MTRKAERLTFIGPGHDRKGPIHGIKRMGPARTKAFTIIRTGAFPNKDEDNLNLTLMSMKKSDEDYGVFLMT